MGVEKTVKHESDGYTNGHWCSWFGKRTRGVGNQKTSKDNSNYNIVEIGQNTEKSPEDLNRLVVNQTPV